jgi:lincosamide nucleotidyltransferase A/C/D/E
MTGMTSMDADAVLEVLTTLEEASVRVWLDGGWGIDALLGEQTRDHADLDIIVDSSDVGELKQALRGIGFQVERRENAANFVLTDERGREVDVHSIEFDQRGFGVFQLAGGRRWPFPPEAFAGEGRVGNSRVVCLSSDAQVQCHGQGYTPSENDLRDMELLQERFGVVLPFSLCRQPDAG